jgi:hypothetical protein
MNWTISVGSCSDFRTNAVKAAYYQPIEILTVGNAVPDLVLKSERSSEFPTFEVGAFFGSG